MNDTAAPSDPDTSDPAAERAGVRLRALRALTELGLDLARDLKAKALAAETPEAAEELAERFVKVARAVAMTVALEDQLDQPAEARNTEAKARLALREAQAAHAEQAADAVEVERKRAQVAGAVRHVIDAAMSLQSIRGADLARGLERRLDREAAEVESFLARPIGELIARICRDLRLKPDWSLWDEDWAVEAESAALPPRRRPVPPEESTVAPRPRRPAAPPTSEAAVETAMRLALSQPASRRRPP